MRATSTAESCRRALADPGWGNEIAGALARDVGAGKTAKDCVGVDGVGVVVPEVVVPLLMLLK